MSKGAGGRILGWLEKDPVLRYEDSATASEVERCSLHGEVLRSGACGACRLERDRAKWDSNLPARRRVCRAEELASAPPSWRAPVKSERKLSAEAKESCRRHYYKFPWLRREVAFGKTVAEDWPDRGSMLVSWGLDPCDEEFVW